MGGVFYESDFVKTCFYNQNIGHEAFVFTGERRLSKSWLSRPASEDCFPTESAEVK